MSARVVHRVKCPIGGMTVADARSRAEDLGLDPDWPQDRFLLALEQVETGWEAVVTFEIGAAGVVPVGVAVQSTRGEPVTRAMWDRLRPAEIIAEAAATVAWLGPITGHPERAQPFETRPQKRGRGKGRPPIYSDDHYRRVAVVYMAAKMEGLPPVRAVAKAFEDQFPGVTAPKDRRARAWVRAARGRGYITEKEISHEGE